MIKNLVFVSIIAVFLFPVSSAFAIAAPTVDISIQMVDFDGDTAGTDNIYGSGDLPWVYIYNVPTSGVSFISSFWWSENDNTKNTYDFSVTSGVTEAWHSPTDWDSISKPEGPWNVSVTATSTLGGSDTETASFVLLTPEPVSSALFLLGGAAFVINRRFRSKKK